MDENWLGYDHLKFGQCINIRINCWVVWVFFIDGSEGLTEQVSQKDSLSLTILLNYGQSLTTRKYSLLWINTSNLSYLPCLPWVVVHTNFSDQPCLKLIKYWEFQILQLSDLWRLCLQITTLSGKLVNSPLWRMEERCVNYII